MNQEAAFLNSEGDAYYRRKLGVYNNMTPISQDVRYLCDSLMPFKDCIDHVLEIGCCSGMKLEAICDRLSTKGHGIDASLKAITAGNTRKKTSDITLHHGSAKHLPFADCAFNLVYFAFSLHWFDRNMLLQSLAEADRVLKPGGFLAIGDFDPHFPRKRDLVHCKGLYTYTRSTSRSGEFSSRRTSTRTRVYMR